MPGNGKAFICHAPEDAERCQPLLQMLDSWRIDYWFEASSQHSAQDMASIQQQAIAERHIFLRVCTPALQRSYWTRLETTAARGLQAEDFAQRGASDRALINLVLDNAYEREPFDYAMLTINAVNRPSAVWTEELRAALLGQPLQSSPSSTSVVSPALTRQPFPHREHAPPPQFLPGQPRPLMQAPTPSAQRLPATEPDGAHAPLPPYPGFRESPTSAPAGGMPPHGYPPNAQQDGTPAHISSRRAASGRGRALYAAGAVVVLVALSLAVFAALPGGHRIPLLGGKGLATATTPPVKWTGDLTSVSMLPGSGEGWAVGINGILHYSNGRWQVQARLTKTLLNGVSMVDRNDGWAVGNAIYHYTGGQWQQVSSPVPLDESPLTSVAMVSRDEGWAVGEQEILHYHNGAWTLIQSIDNPQNLTSDQCDWNHKSFRYPCVLPQAIWMSSSSDGWIATRPSYYYTWTDNSGRQYRAFALLHYTSGQWKQVLFPNETETFAVARAIVSTGKDTWAVGTSGLLLHCSSGQCAVYRQDPSLDDLSGIAMLPSGEGWAVGDNGSIVHYDGSDWRRVTSPTTGNLRAIEMVDGYNNGWAVGDGGVILHYSGGAWLVESAWE